ncbi:MAG: T9SS type A sorting domain-containing protein [Chitinophagales bacterium]
MKKLLFLAGLCSASVVFAQAPQHQKDPYTLTYVKDIHYQPDAGIQKDLRDNAAWQNFEAANGNWWVQFNESTGMPHRAFGKPVETTGSTPQERALNFFAAQLKGYNQTPGELVAAKVNETDKYYYVNFTQYFEGLEVLWSRATVRLSKEGKVAMFGYDVYNDISVNITPGISPEGIITHASSDFTITVNSVEVAPELKILPIITGEGGKYEYKLVYEVSVHTVNAENIPGNYYSLVDANTGKVYYRQNQVHACGEYIYDIAADLEITSSITSNPLLPEVERGLPYLEVEVGGDIYYTDFDGNLTLDFIASSTPATVTLRGPYAKVYQGASGSSIEAIDIMLEPGTNTISFDDLSGALSSEVSAYYYQNVVHDKMKSYWPTFTGLDVPQTIRVERTDGSCNAFYDGSSTNFYAEGGGCPSTALFDDVVMHEYGHGINYDAYDWLGGSWNNGALGEAYADLWGIVVTEYPIVGQGFTGGSDSYVRRYDEEPKVYPEDLVGEVHADGEIIAGAWWDVAENFGDDVQAMADLWIETWYATPMAPGGSEGTLYTDILLEALIADDDNADLSDGTPREGEITSAFCEHGISLAGNVDIAHDPYSLPVEAETPILIESSIESDFPEYLSEPEMFYRLNPSSAWTSIIMTNVGGTDYEVELPAQPKGTILQYYFVVGDESGCAGRVIPVEADNTDPNLPYFALVGYSLEHTEDFDTYFGAWEIDPFNTDEAETGEWDINEPISSTDGAGYEVQTNTDHTTGSSNICAFTGNASSASAGVGENDVDAGETTLRSPIFDMTDYEDPAITYWRLYSNSSPTSANPGNDVWQVRITNDLDNWVTVERTYTEDNTEWRRNAIRVSDYVEVTSTVALLFIAQDSVIPSDPTGFNGGSLIEAAIDDLQIWDTKPEVIDTTTDTTGNSIAELENLINAIFPNPAADYVTVYFGNVSAEMQITIINALGQAIRTETVSAVENKTYRINTSMLPVGAYTMNCKTEKGYVNKQLIISR